MPGRRCGQNSCTGATDFIFYSEAAARAYGSFLTTSLCYIDWDYTGLEHISTPGQYIFYYYEYQKKASDTVFGSRTKLSATTGWDAGSSDNLGRLSSAYVIGGFTEKVFPIFDNLLWSNFDVLNEDGTAFLESSIPVPVYDL